MIFENQKWNISIISNSNKNIGKSKVLLFVDGILFTIYGILDISPYITSSIPRILHLQGNISLVSLSCELILV